MKLLAQKLILPGVSPIEGPAEITSRFQDLAAVVNKLLPLLFVFAGLILFIMFIWGGFSLLTSGGDPQKAEAARGKITNAVIGFVIVFVAYWLTQILTSVFGLQFF